MAHQKRYVGSVEFYLFADNDLEAVQKLKKIANEQAKKNDDSCNALRLVEQPIGKIGFRQVNFKH